LLVELYHTKVMRSYICRKQTYAWSQSASFKSGRHNKPLQTDERRVLVPAVLHSNSRAARG